MTERPFATGAHQTRITVRTFAEGMLARLAHDLELAFRLDSGAADAETGIATIVVDPAAVQVVGARKGDSLDTGALSSHDREEITKKLLSSIGAQAKSSRIRATVTMPSKDSPRPTHGSVEVTLPCGSCRTDVDVTVIEADGVVRAKGTSTLSLRAMGVPEIKGPLGAFRLKDRIEVSFEAELA
jgi:hypothetical protein